MSIKNKKILIALALSAMLYGCQQAMKPNDLTGNFLAETEMGSYVLNLKKDGTFTESGQNKNGKLTKVQGRWETYLEKTDFFGMVNNRIVLNNERESSVRDMLITDNGDTLIREPDVSKHNYFKLR